MEANEGEQNTEELPTNEVQIESSPPEMNFLPLEIWNDILNKVVDPKDILSCSDVCSDWDSLLEHKIMPAYHQLILPQLVPYMRPNDLLSCSGVSHDWSILTDNSIQKVRKKCMPYCFTRRLPRLWMFEDHIQGDRRMSHILTEKDEFAGVEYDNPVAYRNVIIYERERGNNDDAEFDAFCQLQERFLQRFGKHIYQLELDSKCDVLVRMIRMLTICLRNTPNLEVFAINFHHSVYITEGAQQVDDLIEASPLPNSTLKTLKFRDVPPKIIEVLAESYGIQLVALDDFFLLPIPQLTARGVTFQNMTVLSGIVDGLNAGKFSYRPGIRDLDFVIDLLERFNWTLTEIDINIVSGAPYPGTCFEKFFQALHQHQPGLLSLRISDSFGCAVLPPNQRYPSFPLPLLNWESMAMAHLKRLNLCRVGLPTPQFFQNVTPALEYFTMNTEDKSDLILPDGYLDALWEALPNCKEIRFVRRSSNWLDNKDKNIRVFKRSWPDPVYISWW